MWSEELGVKGHFVPIIELRKEYKLKFCEAFPPCAKHREGDQKLRFWWWVVHLCLRFILNNTNIYICRMIIIIFYPHKPNE